jgi:parallel beta-helix repeat protein
MLDKASPGDTVKLADGIYKGGLRMSRSGTAEAPIVIRGDNAKAIIEGGQRDGLVVASSWVVVDGIRFQKAGRGGIGILSEPDSPTQHVTLRNCVCADNGSWGVITSHTNFFTVENNECFGSVKEHGIYVSNSGDDPIVRGNRLHHNAANGLHVNGDPECGGDGIISRGLIEKNVIWENGKQGGSGINLTHVQDSLIRNNLVYHNYASGISIYFDTGGPAAVSRRNKVLNNTFYFRAGEGRFCVNLIRESSEITFRNNIFFGGIYSAAYVDPSCMKGLDMDYNVYAEHPGYFLLGDASEDNEALAKAYRDAGFDVKTETGKGVEVTVESWQKRGYDTHSSFGVAPKFVDMEKGDFHLAPGSAGISAGTPLGDLVPDDLEGNPRPKDKAWDAGCYRGK